MSAAVDQLEAQNPGKFNVVRIYIDKQWHYAEEYKITVIPTIVIFNGSGENVFRYGGSVSSEVLLAEIKKAAAK